MALARILATMHDADGTSRSVASTVTWSVDLAEREALRALPFADEAFRHETGASVLGGEQGFSTLERLWARPTCE